MVCTGEQSHRTLNSSEDSRERAAWVGRWAEGEGRLQQDARGRKPEEETQGCSHSSSEDWHWSSRQEHPRIRREKRASGAGADMPEKHFQGEQEWNQEFGGH